uniref:Lipase n=2 Tax=Cacopsylla melanoneura TaxID=428564 RepID=A0A8D8YPL2_9HEMI
MLPEIRKMWQTFRAHFSLAQILLALLVFTLLSSPVELRRPNRNTANMDYFKLFVEPDSEELRNTPIGPKTWHVKKTLDILKMWGKSGEEHTITTEDGYILSLFRITPLKEKATPVLFLHGLLAAPETWLIRGKEDLAIILNEEGYDVWLGCYRGSNYGRRHVNLTTANEKFWDFSFHEHGLYDAPAMIDHIYRETNQGMAVIAHSMGNAVFMSMLALRPEYNNMVYVFVGMAPYAVARFQFSPLVHTLLPGLVPLLRNINTNTLKYADLYTRRKLNPLVVVCAIARWTCLTTLQFSQGVDFKEIDWTYVLVLAAYFPSGTSNKNIVHIISIGNAQFRQYDYGTTGNLARYKSRTPPVYNLTNVRIPVSLYYGDNDMGVLVSGMKAQVKALPNVIKSTVVKGYNHPDFLLDKNSRRLLYNPILEDLKTYVGTK